MLDADVFAAFFAEVYGVAPFPWQRDLVRTVLADLLWPDLVDAPTGMGKTAMIDIAVFLAAATGGQRGPDRPGRRRILFVVDRRMVVDEAYARALHLAEALDAALRSTETTATWQIASALAALAPDANTPLTVPAAQPVVIAPRPVLAVTRMRGGITWDAAWIDRPDRPAVVVGTVDQVGSRMLFRGYGVSDRRMPIDAALVGTDSLVLVDEAHLAQALLTTFATAREVDGAHVGPDALGGMPGASIVQLTATPGSTSARSHSFDVDAHRHHPVAWRRLNAPKRLSVRATDARGVVAAMADTAGEAIDQGARAVLVVCNTVARARQVHAVLHKMAMRATEPLGADVMLLIGRSRPADRDVLTAELRSRFGLAEHGSGPSATVLVATQTIEVGANLDADALVSESAPWDALVQRLGRLNRFGDYSPVCRAIIVHDGTDDPVYGEPRLQTWAFLSSLAEESDDGIDVSPLACRRLSSTVPPQAIAEPPTAPILLTPTLDAWVRTGPVPVPDPPIAPYLHGLGRQPATVAVAWRDGLLDFDPTGESAERPDVSVHADLVAVPVLPAELVEVPIHAARSWMRGDSAPPISDLDGVDVVDNTKGRRLGDPFRLVAWRSDPAGMSSAGSRGGPPAGGWRWMEADQVRPGDVLVAPTERGGLDEYGWAPESQQVVIDVADAARFASVSMTVQRGRLRLDVGTGVRLGLDGDECRELRRRVRVLSRLGDDDIGDPDEQPIGDWLADAVDRLLMRHPDHPIDRRLPGTAWTPSALAVMRGWLSAGIEVVDVVDPSPGVDTGRAAVWAGGSDRLLVTPRRGAGAIERDDELVECSSMAHRAVSLRDHHANVADRAAGMAQALGLPEPVLAAVRAAAGWHDLGKVEQRFQAMLCGGDVFEALLLDEPLAKSGLDGNDRAGYRLARRRSGLPNGARHEAWSAALVQEFLATTTLPSAILDTDLLVHLVASHHGHARPWLPPVTDGDPREVTATIEGGSTGVPTAKVTISSSRTVDFEHPARFAALNQRYGRWGLALLEAIVRCADMTVSEEGS